MTCSGCDIRRRQPSSKQPIQHWKSQCVLRTDDFFITALPIVRRVCSRNSVSCSGPYCRQFSGQRRTGRRSVCRCKFGAAAEEPQLSPLVTAGSLSAGLELVLKRSHPSMLSSSAFDLTFLIFLSKLSLPFNGNHFNLKWKFQKIQQTASKLAVGCFQNPNSNILALIHKLDKPPARGGFLRFRHMKNNTKADDSSYRTIFI